MSASKTHPQPPDVQGHSANGLPEASLPQGSSTQGMNAHSGASPAEAMRGYLSPPGKSGQWAEDNLNTGLPPADHGGGFVGRPEGWER